MSDWSFKELRSWDRKINKIAKNYGLDWFEIDYEMIDYYDMIGNITYTGMPSHYNHWSFGKSFEKTHLFYNAAMQGLPYEMIINADPSIAYLMRENNLSMHILTMAHCVGHSDFFKNNETFAHTHPETIISKFKNAAARIRGYVEDPSIGIQKVEIILDAAHAIQYQCDRYQNVKKLSHEEIRRRLIEKIKNDTKGEYQNIDIDKIPLQPEFDILGFIADNSRRLRGDWERDLINIVKDHASYFIPQIKTKIMNEGWASFWHYKILNELDLPQGNHLAFLKSHNQVIRPHIGGINPYHLGFHLFKKIEEEKGLDHCFFVREVYNDESFLREFIDEKVCRDLNLFTYVEKSGFYVIDEISDDSGWEKVKSDLIRNTGLNGMPRVYINNVDKFSNYTLSLIHEHDGRELKLEGQAKKVVEHISHLWKDPVVFRTTLDDGDPYDIEVHADVDFDTDTRYLLGLV